ncbi:FHA domain-containing protein [Pseudonocardia hierapolitana]|uniref:FHA domain-containing protein n=1 Tax=Pseudonocardia hierapolitana TaxID=1128676 RepID=A0A561T2B3_9PSEU|nr:FHA domain-containing protein [Pseudonocardia hierapolitana]TWF81253.1 FHA domain-containing protein [Pseudonocardia hierapolitana]
MTPCTEDHAAATGEYCDVCGLRLRGAQPQPASSPPAPAERCPNCGAGREGRFCEVCGYDSALGPPPEPASEVPAADVPAADVPETPAPRPRGGAWTAVVRADRAWFEEVLRRNGPDAGTLQFPAFSTERRFVLDGPQLAIGRRSRSRGIEPEIDLSAPPVDPGVSALHALLVHRDDGGWEVVDLDSTNGTIVGERSDPIPPNTPVRLADGDVVKVGAWTTITLVAPD